MAEQTLGLVEAIAELRRELTAANRAAADEPLKLPITTVSVELQVVVTRRADGQAGFSLPIIGLGLGGSAGVESEVTHKVSLTFGPPTDAAGEPISVHDVTPVPKR